MERFLWGWRLGYPAQHAALKRVLTPAWAPAVLVQVDRRPGPSHGGQGRVGNGGCGGGGRDGGGASAAPNAGEEEQRGL